MGKEDEARFLPTYLLSDDTMTTASDQPLSMLPTASSPAVQVGLATSFETDNNYGYMDAKSLPTFFNESCHNKKLSLRKTLSLRVAGPWSRTGGGDGRPQPDNREFRVTVRHNS